MRRTKKETDVIVARMDFLRDLLKEFDASLAGYQPGVTAYIVDKERNRLVPGHGYTGESLSFDSTEWNWLEPLLIELRDKRKNKSHSEKDFELWWKKWKGQWSDGFTLDQKYFAELGWKARGEQSK